jgi:hypothetical protein
MSAFKCPSPNPENNIKTFLKHNEERTFSIMIEERRLQRPTN